MKLLHPFMPFITEELYQQLPGTDGSIMQASWPTQQPDWQFASEADTMEAIMDMIRQIRNVRAEMKVPPSQRITMCLIVADPAPYRNTETYFIRLAGAESVCIADNRGEIGNTDIHLIGSGIEAVIPLASLVDMDKERERIDKEIARMEGDIQRAEGKLGNAAFVQKAPQAVVEEERRKLKEAQEMLRKLRERRKNL